MKKLALITNELFKDYMRIVSTDDLEKTLDNPDVPVPYECLDSVANKNSDELAQQLSLFFSQSKLPNKDFYKLNEENSKHLQFMMGLIKLSSGDTSTLVEPVKDQAVPKVEEFTPVEQEVIEQKEEIQPVVTPEPPVVEEVVKPTIPLEDLIGTKKDSITEQVEFTPSPEGSPFDLKEDYVPVVAQEEVVEPIVEKVTEEQSVELIPVLNIPKNSTITLAKKESVTATIIDENNAIFDGVTMSLTEAAKAGFKKAGMFGVAVGNVAWLYNGTALKDLK